MKRTCVSMAMLALLAGCGGKATFSSSEDDSTYRIVFPRFADQQKVRRLDHGSETITLTGAGLFDVATSTNGFHYEFI